MKDTTELAERIVKLREQSGLTQEQVANRLGISRQRFILVEQGKRDISSTEIETLSYTFGVNPSDLLDEVPNIAKFRQMYLLFLQLSANKHGNVPKTKLAKLLYLADFTNFFEELESMSGVKYRRLEYGPVADAFFSITDDLLDSGKVGLELLDGGAQMLSLKSRQVPTDLLSKKEQAVIYKIAGAWKNKPAQEIVNFTHEQLPWSMCRDGELIPYVLIIQEDPDHVFQPAA